MPLLAFGLTKIYSSIAKHEEPRVLGKLSPGLLAALEGNIYKPQSVYGLVRVECAGVRVDRLLLIGTVCGYAVVPVQFRREKNRETSDPLRRLAYIAYTVTRPYN